MTSGLDWLKPSGDASKPPRQPVAASSPLAEDRSRVLKHGDTFAVLNHAGGIEPGGLGEEGLYHESTRFLSLLSTELDDRRLFFLGPAYRGDDSEFRANFTNPELDDGGASRLLFGALHVSLRVFLWRRVLYQQVTVKNYAAQPVEASLTFRFAADFADIFEIRGMRRQARGHDMDPRVSHDEVSLAYRGLDGVVRKTMLTFSPAPDRLDGDRAEVRLAIPPSSETSCLITVGCDSGVEAPRPLIIEHARAEARAEAERRSAWSCHLQTSNGFVNNWIARATADLDMLTTELPTGPYPYAGLPWFNTPFGRDGIITALETLWLRPELARGVLTYLASTQATETIADRDAEPGKILHETRNGEMASLREMPFGRYYGTADATPLFVLLAGEYYCRTGDLDFARLLWPNVEAALSWVDAYGDCDGDGFVEYQRKAATGLLHHGWRDSDDAVFRATGFPAPEGPIALCEAQAYVFAARHAAVRLARALGHPHRAADLARRAEQLRRNFEAAFWCDDLSTYAAALDGDKRQCRAQVSSAGHSLFAGIAAPERAGRLAKTLLSDAFYSGWGIRTLSSAEERYNPMSYHNGSVWPHDSALIAYGLARYGYGELALRILTGLMEASLYFELRRMPELFCGFPRQPDEAPVLYPVACSPQAWAASSTFLLLQATLGLEINALDARIRFSNPQLPPHIGELRIHNLHVGKNTVDLLVTSQEQDVGVDVLRREGPIEVIVVK